MQIHLVQTRQSKPGTRVTIVEGATQLHLVFQMAELALVVIVEGLDTIECIGCTNGKKYTPVF